MLFQSKDNRLGTGVYRKTERRAVHYVSDLADLWLNINIHLLRPPTSHRVPSLDNLALHLDPLVSPINMASSTDGLEYYDVPNFQFAAGTRKKIKVAYRCFNPSSDKGAILIPTCFGGKINTTLNFTSGALKDYHVIVVAMLGNGESSSPSNDAEFPTDYSLRYQVRSTKLIILPRRTTIDHGYRTVSMLNTLFSPSTLVSRVWKQSLDSQWVANKHTTGP